MRGLSAHLVPGDDPPVGVRRIVVGVDGGEPGWQALSWAVEEAQACGADLVMCQARAEPLPDSGGPLIERVELFDPPLARQLHAARDRLGGARVELAFRDTDAVAALLDPAYQADLVVLGGGRRQPTHRPFRSVVLRVTAGATCPVVVVRPAAGRRSAPFAGHVVVGVDGSDPARTALRFAFEYAERHRAPLAAVFVTTVWPGDLWYDDRLLETHFSVEPPFLGMLANEVEPFEHRYTGVPVKRAAYGGRPVDGLLHAAAGARLLVVGRRRGRCNSVLDLGWVGDHLVHRAECPLAVVPAVG